MRKFLGVIGLLLCLVAFSQAEADLVGYWSMDGVKAVHYWMMPDLSGNGNDLSITDIGVKLTSDAISGLAYPFNGTPRWLADYDVTALNFGTGPMTIAAWVKSGTIDNGGIVTKHDGDAGYLLTLRGHDSGKIMMELTGPTYDQRRAERTLSAGWNDNQWHHVVGVYDGDDIRIFVDGIEQATDEWTTGTPPDTTTTKAHAPFYIGRFRIWGPDFDGIIDEVRVYDEALTAVEVEVLYQLTGCEDDLSTFNILYLPPGIRTAQDSLSKNPNAVVVVGKIVP